MFTHLYIYIYAHICIYVFCWGLSLLIHVIINIVVYAYFQPSICANCVLLAAQTPLTNASPNSALQGLDGK